MSAGVSGGLPYGVYRSLIPGEIKVGWIVVAGGTHKGAVFQERQSSGCRGRKCQWGLGWVMNGAPLSDVIDDEPDADDEVDGPPVLVDQLRPKLITSSTKRRVNELSGLQHQVADDCECL